MRAFFSFPSLVLVHISWVLSNVVDGNAYTITLTLTHIAKDFGFCCCWFFEFISNTRTLVRGSYVYRVNANVRDRAQSKHLPTLRDHFYFIIFSWFTITIFCAVYLALAHLWLFSSFAPHIYNMRDGMTHRTFKNEILQWTGNERRQGVTSCWLSWQNRDLRAREMHSILLLHGPLIGM